MSFDREVVEIMRITKEMSQIQGEYANIKPSEYDVGERYLYGYTRKFDDRIHVDIPIDYSEASKHFKNDLESGRGYYGWGIMYLKGLGCEKNLEKAKQCFDYAWPLLNKYADTNDGSFDRLIADAYYYGDRGQPRNLMKAKAKYTSAAQKGDGPSLYSLAYNYFFGPEVAPGWEIDKTKALYYAKRSVLHPHYNYVYGGYLAGCMLDELGRGDEALKYFEEAAHLGQDDSQVVIALHYEELDVYELAVPMYRRAYEQGNVFAQFKMGYCFYYGLNVTRDTQKGLRLIYDAASKGDEDAKIFLRNL